ncbi:EfeM/EfeO family lipoprotein [Actinacidiphila epipremni]|uniref:EfeM/EfeO family lipoprotein n=1 Tax=Actinacidiphila epipremni TaxID=2053013 RepID=UPI002AFE1A87|nr:EfeM/EfeO family lipoprotein [Actinacidiphila epipremni]
MSAEPDGIEPPQPPPSPSGPRVRFSRRWQAGAAAVAVAAAVTATVLVAGSGGSSRHGAASAAGTPDDGLPHTAIEVSTGTCGRGWTKPRPGRQVFDLHNISATASEVYLDDPRTGKIYGEVDGLAPGTSRPLTVDLGSGSYAFKCLENDADAVTGPTVVVAGDVPQGPAAAPVNQHDLIPPTLAYQKWVGQRIGDLAAGTAKLKADIDHGDLAAARTDWLTAHLVYERMGAAYDTFGDADGAINGTAARTPGAVDDPGFTGFHRIEYGLWHGQSAAALRAPAAALDAAVRELQGGWSQQRMDPAAMGLRAHEIIENAEQFELTARTDYGSGTNLATASANIDGTRAILVQLRSLLVPRYPDVAALDAALDRAQADLAAQHHGAAWTPVDKLTQAQRERINADFGDLLERLAPVATIFEVRRTA